MLYVTFHGGKPGRRGSLNNIYAYDKTGKLVSQTVLEETPGIVLSELRAMRLIDDRLYVVAANRTQNGVLCYEKKGKIFRHAGTFASQATCPGILHPFDLTFDDAGFCYVSSQDTNVVSRLKVSKDGRTATPTQNAPALPEDGKFLPGTFVASSVNNLSTPGTTAIPAPAGLTYSGVGEKKHSVRGVLWVNGALHVVDQPAGVVKVYDEDGNLIGQSNKVKEPVHLHARKGTLYVTGGDQVLHAKLPKTPGNFTLLPIESLKMKDVGGLVSTRSGQFYMASRTGRSICKFDSQFNPVTFESALPDDPEFLLHV